MITFASGKQLGPGDLNIVLRDESGAVFNAYSITYTLYQIVDNNKVLVGTVDSDPVFDATGIYHVALTIPTTWAGQYQVVWKVKRYDDSPIDIIHEDFSVVSFTPTSSASYEAPSVMLAQRLQISPKTAEWVMTVRHLISDENPDRNYHFRPPTAGKTVAGYSSRVGFIWTDETILRLLKLAIAQLNTTNPLMSYGYTTDNIPEDWAQAACVGAAAHCLNKEAARWTADEFGYSLNGVSLDINKAQQYQGLGSTYMEEFKTWAETLAATKPASVGLRQQRWLLG